MGWNKKDLKRSYACNGPLLVQFRERRGWTQRELAKKSGYSERLVSKAEAGQPLAPDTIDVLAQTYSTPAEPVFPEDLVSDPEALARQLIAAYLQYKEEFPARIRHFVDDDVLMWCAGDPALIPFAGEFRGFAGFEQCWKTFFAVMEHPEHVYEPQWMSHGNIAVAWGLDHSHPRGMPDSPPVSVTQRFTFSRGKLVEFRNFFDTDAGSKILAEARARTMLG